MEQKENIRGGSFQVARQLFGSDIWLRKPSGWKVIWIYILGNVSHKATKNFARGEGYFNFSQDHKNIGCDITKDMIKKALRSFKDCDMISTTKSTRGVRIKVLKYDTYQTIQNYCAPAKAPVEAPEKHHESTTINKNEKNEKNINTESEKNISYLLEIPQEDIKEFMGKFNIYEQGIRGKGEDLYNWAVSKGAEKKYKNFKALLRNALKKDFGLKAIEAPKVWEQPVNQTRSEEGLKKLADMKKKFNFGMKKI